MTVLKQQSFFWGGNLQKKLTYENDVEFLLGFEAIQQAIGGEAMKLLGKVACLTIKSDGLVFRRQQATFDWLDRNGFKILRTFSFTPTTAAQLAIWRYQWNAAAPQRVWLSTLIGAAAPWICLLLEDVSEGTRLPCVRLASLKGTVGDANNASLRGSLGATRKMFGYVHCSDTASDIVRELTILLGARNIGQIVADLVDGCRGVSDRERSNLVAMSDVLPAIDPDPASSLARIRKKIVENRGRWQPLESLASRGTPDLRFLEEWLERRQELDLLWDAFSCAIDLVPLDRSGVRALLSSGSTR